LIRSVVLAVIFAVVVALLAAWAGLPKLATVFHVLLGWVNFLVRVLPSVTVAWGGVLTALVCVVLLLAGGHALLRWLHHQLNASTGSTSVSHPWRVRWTGLLVAVFVLLFVAGLSVVGIVHQTAWLATQSEPLVERRVALSLSTERNLTGMYLDAEAWSSLNKRPWSGCTYAASGEPLHSWQFVHLPFTYLREDVHVELPWDHPTNAPYFKRFIVEYLHPDVRTLRDERGFALSHFAGNVHVLGPKAAPTDLPGQTLLIGEAADQFKAWGNPSNWRDPNQGLNTRGGFASPTGKEVQFVLLDGSVRQLGADTDRAVLRRLSGQRE